MAVFDSVIDSQLAKQGHGDILEPFNRLSTTNCREDIFSDNFFLTEGISGDSLLSIAVNNFAVCAVFLKKISIAMRKLENIIQDNPVQNMSDPIVFNLCTIYDLSYSPDISSNKKKMIQRIAAIYNIEEINWRSFRLA